MDSPRSSMPRSSRRSSSGRSTSDRRSSARRSTAKRSGSRASSSKSKGSQGSAWDSGMEAINDALKGNFDGLKSLASSGINSKEGIDTGIETFEELKHALNDSNAMQELSAQTGLQPILLFIIFSILSVVVMIACLSIQSLGLLMSRMIGFVYPAYASFKALETTDTQIDDTQWLTYWVTFAMLSIAEDVLLHTDSPIPLYLAAKVTFLLWCQLMNGSAFLYTLVVRPTALKVTAFLEDAVQKGLFAEADDDYEL